MLPASELRSVATKKCFGAGWKLNDGESTVGDRAEQPV